MNGFIAGMGSLNLFPPVDRTPQAWQPGVSLGQAWQDVGKAFREAGDCIRLAMYEQAAQINAQNPALRK